MAHAQLEWHPVLAELPEEYKEFMGNREKKIEDILKTRYLDPLRLLLAQWGKRGSQEYAQVREAMKLQLENDPEYASQFSIVHVTEDIDSTLFEISMEEKDIPGNA